MVRSKHAGHSPKNLEYWSLYGTYVGKMTATKQHTAPWEKSTKSTSKKKNPPQTPYTYCRHTTRFENTHG